MRNIFEIFLTKVTRMSAISNGRKCHLCSRSTHQLNIKDTRGRTALHLAATNGHYDMVSLLIGQGANINAMDIVL